MICTEPGGTTGDEVIGMARRALGRAGPGNQKSESIIRPPVGPVAHELGEEPRFLLLSPKPPRLRPIERRHRICQEPAENSAPRLPKILPGNRPKIGDVRFFVSYPDNRVTSTGLRLSNAHRLSSRSDCLNRSVDKLYAYSLALASFLADDNASQPGKDAARLSCLTTMPADPASHRYHLTGRETYSR